MKPVARIETAPLTWGKTVPGPSMSWDVAERDTTAHEKIAGLRMLRSLGGQRFLALMALMSPPMSLTRDTDLAQRTVTLFGGAREGETVFFGVLTAVT